MGRRSAISTTRAPNAIGPYSQAVRDGNTVFLSGQIPLSPQTQQPVSGDLRAQARQVLENLKAVAVAAGGSLAGIVKLNIYLTDMEDFPVVNELMSEYFEKPYPARATVQVTALPKGAPIEIDAVMTLDGGDA